MKRRTLLCFSLFSPLKTSTSSTRAVVFRKIARFSTSSQSQEVPAVVTPEWLAENIKNVRVLDATWIRGLSGKTYSVPVPGSAYFDIDAIADTSSPKPHRLPSAEVFAREMDKLGITNDDHVVVYDQNSGQFIASARAWWTFRVFGHKKVSALEGGSQAWPEGVVIPERKVEASAGGIPNYRAVFNKSLVWTLADVLKNQEEGTHLLVDVRAAERFCGREDEPWPGVPRGSIPHTYNMPYPNLFKHSTLDGLYRLKPADELQEAFAMAGIPVGGKYPITTLCGSGITACISALALYTLGVKDVAVYDGSWHEYGTHPDTPKVKGRVPDSPESMLFKVLSLAGNNLVHLEQKWETLPPDQKEAKLNLLLDRLPPIQDRYFRPKPPIGIDAQGLNF